MPVGAIVNLEGQETRATPAVTAARPSPQSDALSSWDIPGSHGSTRTPEQTNISSFCGAYAFMSLPVGIRIPWESSSPAANDIVQPLQIQIIPRTEDAVFPRYREMMEGESMYALYEDPLQGYRMTPPSIASYNPFAGGHDLDPPQRIRSFYTIEGDSIVGFN
jgi:hypothetical protein